MGQGVEVGDPPHCRRFILDAHGQPIECRDPVEWSSWMCTANRRLAYAKHGDTEVSTIFMGLDIEMIGGVRRLWETRIFGGVHSLEKWRWTTSAEAAAGHDRVVSWIKGEGVRP